MTETNLKKSLCCPACKGDLKEAAAGLECGQCRRHYPRSGKAIVFLAVENKLSAVSASDSLVLKIKNFLKQSPKLFKFLYRLTTPLVGKKPAVILDYLPSDALIINLGSGVMSIDSRILDVDYIAYPNVSIVADAAALPFKDSSVDAVISESLLEHVQAPEKVIAEVKRVLKPGGLLYLQTPFMLGFHSSPNDYYRWTVPGLAELCKDFRKEDSGVAVGPTSALTTLLSEWLSLVLSFGSATLYQCWSLFFLIVGIPFKWLDVLLGRLPFSSNIAQAVYFIGRKK